MIITQDDLIQQKLNQIEKLQLKGGGQTCSNDLKKVDLCSANKLYIDTDIQNNLPPVSQRNLDQKLIDLQQDKNMDQDIIKLLLQTQMQCLNLENYERIQNIHKTIKQALDLVTGLKNSLKKRQELDEDRIIEDLRRFFIFPEKFNLDKNDLYISHEIYHMDLKFYKRKLGKSKVSLKNSLVLFNFLVDSCFLLKVEFGCFYEGFSFENIVLVKEKGMENDFQLKWRSIAGINREENFFSRDYETFVDPFYYYSPNRDIKQQQKFRFEKSVNFRNEEDKLKNQLYSIFMILIEFLFPTEDFKLFLKATLKESEIFMQLEEKSKSSQSYFILQKSKLKEICYQILNSLEPQFLNNQKHPLKQILLFIYNQGIEEIYTIKEFLTFYQSLPRLQNSFKDNQNKIVKNFFYSHDYSILSNQITQNKIQIPFNFTNFNEDFDLEQLFYFVSQNYKSVILFNQQQGKTTFSEILHKLFQQKGEVSSIVSLSLFLTLQELDQHISVIKKSHQPGVSITFIVDDLSSFPENHLIHSDKMHELFSDHKLIFLENKDYLNETAWISLLNQPKQSQIFLYQVDSISQQTAKAYILSYVNYFLGVENETFLNGVVQLSDYDLEKIVDGYFKNSQESLFFIESFFYLQKLGQFFCYSYLQGTLVDLGKQELCIKELSQFIFNWECFKSVSQIRSQVQIYENLFEKYICNLDQQKGVGEKKMSANSLISDQIKFQVFNYNQRISKRMFFYKWKGWSPVKFFPEFKELSLVNKLGVGNLEFLLLQLSGMSQKCLSGEISQMEEFMAKRQQLEQIPGFLYFYFEFLFLNIWEQGEQKKIEVKNILDYMEIREQFKSEKNEKLVQSVEEYDKVVEKQAQWIAQSLEISLVKVSKRKNFFVQEKIFFGLIQNAFDSFTEKKKHRIMEILEFLVEVSKFENENTQFINASSNAFTLLNILGHNFEKKRNYRSVKAPFADIRNCFLQNCDFSKSNFCLANFSDSCVNKSEWAGSNLQGIVFNEETMIKSKPNEKVFDFGVVKDDLIFLCESQVYWYNTITKQESTLFLNKSKEKAYNKVAVEPEVEFMILASLDKVLEVYDYSKKEMILDSAILEKLVYLGLQKQTLNGYIVIGYDEKDKLYVYNLDFFNKKLEIVYSQVQNAISCIQTKNRFFKPDKKIFFNSQNKFQPGIKKNNFYVGFLDGNLKSFSLEYSTFNENLKKFPSSISSMDFCEENQNLWVGIQSGTLSQFIKGQEVQSVQAFRNSRVETVKSDRRMVVVFSQNGKIKFFSTRLLEVLKKYSYFERESQFDKVFLQENQMFCLAKEKGQVKGQEVRVLELESIKNSGFSLQRVLQLTAACEAKINEKRCVFYATKKNKIHLENIHEQKSFLQLSVNSKVLCLRVSIQQNYLAYSCEDQNVIVRDLHQVGFSIIKVEKQTQQIPLIRFSNDSKNLFLAGGKQDFTILLWNLQDLKTKKEIQLKKTAQVTCLEISHDNLYFAAGLKNGFIEIVSTVSKETANFFEAHPVAVNSLSFGCNKTSVFSVSLDKNVKEFNFLTGQTLRNFPSPEQTIQFSSYILEIQTLIVITSDKNVIVFDPKGNVVFRYAMPNTVLGIYSDQINNNFMVYSKNHIFSFCQQTIDAQEKFDQLSYYLQIAVKENNKILDKSKVISLIPTIKPKNEQNSSEWVVEYKKGMSTQYQFYNSSINSFLK